MSVLAPVRFLSRFGGFCADCSRDERKLSEVKEHDDSREIINGEVPDLISNSESNVADGTEVNALYGQLQSFECFVLDVHHSFSFSFPTLGFLCSERGAKLYSLDPIRSSFRKHPVLKSGGSPTSVCLLLSNWCKKLCRN